MTEKNYNNEWFMNVNAVEFFGYYGPINLGEQ